MVRYIKYNDLSGSTTNGHVFCLRFSACIPRLLKRMDIYIYINRYTYSIVTPIRFQINYCKPNPYNIRPYTHTVIGIDSLAIIIYIYISFRSERRLVAVVAVVRMQFTVRQRATEKDQSVQQSGAAQRGQTLRRVRGE